MKVNIVCQGLGYEDYTSGIKKFFPNNSNIYKGVELYMGSNLDVVYDYIIILDSIYQNYQYKVLKDLLFCSAEVPFIINYFPDNAKKFLNQFETVFTAHAVYEHQDVIVNLPFQPWMINANHGLSIIAPDEKYNYDTMMAMNHIKKTKMLSIISSNKLFTEFHRVRYEFALAMKRHFKDKIDLYGSGHAPFDSKVVAVMPYKYHIAIENQITPNVITEKLYDTYLSMAYPIYCGAPNVSDYFDKESYSEINVYDLRGSIKKIEQIIEEDQYEHKIPALIEAKRRSLHDYNLFIRIAEICLNRTPYNNTYREGVIKSVKGCRPKVYKWQKFKNSVKKRLPF